MFEEIGSTTLFLCLIVLLLSLIALTLLVLLIHSGLFLSVEEVGTAKPPLGNVAIAYKFLKGPYNESGQTFTEAHIIAPDNKCVGIYYDDPRKVPSHELRYAVGCVLGPNLSEVDPAMLSRFDEKGFKTITLPEVEYAVQTSFPHVTTLSILIGIHKAYPRLSEYIEERKLCAHPFLEFYSGDHIHFFAPLSKQEEFWVPECQLDGRGDENADSSDINTTLDTSHSVLGDESTLGDEETPRATPEKVTEATNISTEVLEVSLEKEVGEVSGGGDGGKDRSVNPEIGDVVVDEAVGNGGGTGEEDDNDNSSSSSFEVLKNEATE